MKFAEIIREAGFSVDDYPNAAQIPVKLYDRKDRIVQGEYLKFDKPLFEENELSKLAFGKLILKLEKVQLPEISIRIDEEVVAVYYKSVHVKIFSRHEIDLLDFMN